MNGSKAIKREAEGAVRKGIDKAFDDAEEVFMSVKRNDAAQSKDPGQCAKAHGKWEGGSCSRDPATAHKAMGKIKSRVKQQIEGKSPVIMTKAQQNTYMQEVEGHIKRFEEHPAMDDEKREAIETSSSEESCGMAKGSWSGGRCSQPKSPQRPKTYCDRTEGSCSWDAPSPSPSPSPSPKGSLRGSSADLVIQSTDVEIASLEKKGSNLKKKKKSMGKQFNKAKKFVKSSGKKVVKKAGAAVGVLGSAVGVFMGGAASTMEVRKMK